MRSSWRISLLLGTALTGAACHDGDEPVAAPPRGAATERPPEAAPPVLDPRDQYALAHEIHRARTDDEDRQGQLARTRAAWIGRRFRWDLAFVPALCPERGSCVALPFDHQRDPGHPIRQGWLPRLDLDAPARRDLVQQCQGLAPCVVGLSGRLTQLELSVELPPSLTLADIEVHDIRASKATELWIAGSHTAVDESFVTPATGPG